MSNKQSFFILIFMVCGFACTGKGDKEKKTGQIVIDEQEKSRLLKFYSAPDDSLKKKAAIFLLENISVHYSNENLVLKRLKKKYVKEKKGRKSVDLYRTFSSTLKAVSGHGDITELKKINDDILVPSDYIIDNIEQAFKVWKSKDKTDNIDFDTFCEYILPYRVMDEPLDYNRKYYRKKYTSIIHGKRSMYDLFDTIVKVVPVRYNKSMDSEFPYLMGVGLSQKVGIGNCMQQAVSKVMILRSVGIPATIDYVPQWGNYPGRHYMAKLIDGKKKSIFELSLLDFKFIIPKDSLPEGIADILYIKTIPKVYRMTWSAQPERLMLNSNGRTEKTGLFQNLYEKDVTDEYTECSTFNLYVRDTVYVAYLCVFGRNGWMPVCATPVNGDSAIFEKVGRNIVYLPTIYKMDDVGKGYMQPVSDPFYFTDEGLSITLTGKDRKKQNVKLYSKYPVCSYTAAHSYRMKGGKFQGANKTDFSDAKDLFTINYFPFYKQEIKIENNEKFRYFRYLPPRDAVYGFSELQFYTQDGNNNQKQISGTFFEQNKIKELNFKFLNDGDLDTYAIMERWIGYDVGKNNKVRLTGITFACQNDGNCIVPGYTYELFFWQDGKWMSSGEKEATQNYLEYKNIPMNALLWLKCHTKGREERIFTYKNNKQIWW